jgi:hypothetical protein
MKRYIVALLTILVATVVFAQTPPTHVEVQYLIEEERTLVQWPGVVDEYITRYVVSVSCPGSAWTVLD